MCNKAFYLWELIEFTSERESDLRHQGGLGSGSLISMLKKLYVSFDLSSSATDMTMNGSVIK